MTRHPLAAKVAHWPLGMREQHAELAARLQHTGSGCSREESERRAEEMVRAYHERWGEGPVWTASGKAPQTKPAPGPSVQSG